MKQTKKTLTKILTRRFISIFDLGLRHKYRIDNRTDAEKLAGDWKRVGGDLYYAMDTLDVEKETESVKEAVTLLKSHSRKKRKRARRVTLRVR